LSLEFKFRERIGGWAGLHIHMTAEEAATLVTGKNVELTTLFSVLMLVLVIVVVTVCVTVLNTTISTVVAPITVDVWIAKLVCGIVVITVVVFVGTGRERQRHALESAGLAKAFSASGIPAGCRFSLCWASRRARGLV